MVSSPRPELPKEAPPRPPAGGGEVEAAADGVAGATASVATSSVVARCCWDGWGRGTAIGGGDVAVVVGGGDGDVAVGGDGWCFPGLACECWGCFAGLSAAAAACSGSAMGAPAAAGFVACGNISCAVAVTLAKGLGCSERAVAESLTALGLVRVVALRVAGMVVGVRAVEEVVAKEAEVTGPLPVDKEAGTAQEELG